MFIEHYYLEFSREPSLDNIIGLEYLNEKQLDFIKKYLNILTLKQQYLLNKYLIKNHKLPLNNLYYDEKCLSCINFEDLEKHFSCMNNCIFPEKCKNCLHLDK